MPQIEILKIFLSCALLGGLAGCSDGIERKNKPSPPPMIVRRVAPKGDEPVNAKSVQGATPAELAHMKACLEAIDCGRNTVAMRHARELMDSTNAEVRLQAVEFLGWIGRFALGDLAEMMADENEDVRLEAENQWEMAFEEISSDHGKMQAIEMAVTKLKKQHSLETVMMKLSSLEDWDAVRTLSNIIVSTNSTPVAIEVARSEYVSLSDEPFASAERAEQVAAILKNRAERFESPPQGQRQPKKKEGLKQDEQIR